MVVDGGSILSARRTAINEAEAAARAGAGAVATSSLRNNRAPVTIDNAAAQRRVNDYMQATGHNGVTTVSGDRIAVEVSFAKSLTLLKLIGVGDVEVHGYGEARSIRGITREGD